MGQRDTRREPPESTEGWLMLTLSSPPLPSAPCQVWGGGGESSNDKMKKTRPWSGTRPVSRVHLFIYLLVRLFPSRRRRQGGGGHWWGGLQGTHLMMHSGIWMFSMGMSFSSSSKLATYFILLLNLALRQEKHAHTHTHVRTGPSDSRVRVSGSVSQKMLPGLFIS